MEDFQDHEVVESTEIKGSTKVVNGLTLHWSEPEKMYALPVMEKAKTRLLYDEPTGNFIQVAISEADFFYSDSETIAPDGTKTRQRILIARNKHGQPILLPDPETQKAVIRYKLLEAQKSAIEIAQSSAALFLIGFLISIVFFFYYLICESRPLAKAFAEGGAKAMTEVGFWAAIIGSVVIGGFVLKYLIPALFKARSLGYEPEERAPSYDSSLNINVTQNTGAGNGAQNIINDRKL